MEYYDGTKLLSMKDINGETPEIYLCTSNRSAGKTTYFARYFVNRFLKNDEKFGLLYRWSEELNNVAAKFFNDIGSLFFQGYEMEGVNREKGAYVELFLNGESCGYAFALNAADKIKKFSHLLSQCRRILFDEFQSECAKYCPNEVDKFVSIHTSLARGGGKQCRYLPVFMLSDLVSLLNPYYTAFGISQRLRSDTKFLRGEGFVLEQGFNESAANAQKNSAFNRAFVANRQIDYLTQMVYLNDSTAFIETPAGRSRYIATLKYKGKSFGIREYPDLGIAYCTTKADESYPERLSVTTADHNINYVMLNSMKYLVLQLRSYFEHGVFRFQNLEAKEALMAAVSY